eukprot:2829331-Rhodomonas_salina.1
MMQTQHETLRDPRVRPPYPPTFIHHTRNTPSSPEPFHLLHQSTPAVSGSWVLSLKCWVSAGFGGSRVLGRVAGLGPLVARHRPSEVQADAARSDADERAGGADGGDERRVGGERRAAVGVQEPQHAHEASGLEAGQRRPGRADLAQG